MRRPSPRSTSRQRRTNGVGAGRHLNVPLIVGLMLAGILIGLGMWIWLFFDYEAYKQARKTSAVIVQIPPPIEIKKTKNTSQESLENRSNGHGDTLDNAVGHSPEPIPS